MTGVTRSLYLSMIQRQNNIRPSGSAMTLFATIRRQYMCRGFTQRTLRGETAVMASITA